MDFWRTYHLASDLNGTDYSGVIYPREAMRLVLEQICGIVPEHVVDCGTECVYNLEKDPQERVNLNGSSVLLHRLLAKLEQELLTTFNIQQGLMIQQRVHKLLATVGLSARGTACDQSACWQPPDLLACPPPRPLLLG